MAATMFLVPPTNGSPVVARDRLGPRALTTESAPPDLRRRPHVHGDQVCRNPTVAGLHRTYGLYVGGEAAPGVGVGQAGLDGSEVLAHPLGEHRGDQVTAGREPPVERGVPRPRPPGDLVQRRVQAVLGEHLPG
jgi:hypothetical protein